MKSLYEIVDQALNMGIRINATQDMFGDTVLSRVNILRKTNQDSEIIATIICKLISKGMPILENVRNFKEVCDKYHDNIEKAKRKFNNRLNELKEVAQRGLTKGELQNCEIDNTNFYLKHSEDSIIDVAKIVNKTTLNSDIQLSYGLMKIGNNEVEIETNNGIRNYTDLSDNGNVVLTFSTSLGELKVVLKQRKDSIEVKVCDQKMFDQLVNSQEELGKNCRLGGLPVSEAINRGFFIRSSKPFSSYENTTPFNEMKNIHKKEGWCERISNEVKYSRERGI
ncbi:MAG: hypothetical protein KTV77_02325 [Wolbachia endosymbiont of Fragariocoptes setiger]|nr:hypothetical protein [Wolbachia endosymbiont of Fragariocoptes setiger]